VAAKSHLRFLSQATACMATNRRSVGLRSRRWGSCMATVKFYLSEAKRLMLLAAADSDPLIKELLERRARKYLHMADALEAELSQTTAIEPPAAAPAVQQQQQQIQPSKKEE